MDEVTAGFTVADWARLEDTHLDVVVTRSHLLAEIAELGVDMDEDPVAVYCQLYLRFIEHDPDADLWQHMTGGQDHPAVPETGSEKEVPQ